MGLLIIGFLAVFMTGAQSGKEPTISKTGRQMEMDQAMAPNAQPNKGQQNMAQKPGQQKPNQGQNPMANSNQPNHANPAQNQVAANPNHLSPAEAVEFVKFWIGGAMDYHANTAEKNREKALAWMTEDAAQAFKATFWTRELKHGITSGSIIAHFQTISVQATAVNPDGSVVVHVRGSVAMQMDGHAPGTEHLMTDYLVKKEANGLRIAGVHNKTYIQASSPTSSYY